MTDFQSGQPGLVTCLSCDELNTRGGSCGYNRFQVSSDQFLFSVSKIKYVNFNSSFEFSSDNSYYAMSCDGPHVPQVRRSFCFGTLTPLHDSLHFLTLDLQVYMYETNPNTRINLLVDNAKLSSDLAVKSLPKVSSQPRCWSISFVECFYQRFPIWTFLWTAANTRPR